MEFTIHFATINLLVVFGATVAALLLGGFWYSPAFLGKPWRRASGIPVTGDQIPNPVGTFTAGFFFQLLAASMLAGLMGPTATGIEGLQLGMLLAFSFVMTALAIVNLFERRPRILIAIHSCYNIVSFGLMGFIIGQWS
ncbi:MAG: DUF1761 domain-containing protein [Gammaproteobacteria bacterium]|jgi:hypothetical protein|nr:DUF1761 domain-containing protein [Gammaproteobacteria bacterium]MDP6617304.1 DUF1761 domain-containing protein [Gammaproteobacteria bacterium]MDP6694082.1 DUF1761 domain-containing protein [Gammaproteobacteria bacterium]MDP7041103.1 DUF1761 domain-containing protein [Gammaproteobacteria bacterium]